MSEAYQRVLKDLPLLTTDEREAIKARIVARGTLETNTVSSQMGDEVLVLEAIVDVVQRLSGEVVSVYELRRMNGYTGFKTKAISLLETLGKSSGTRLKKIAVLTLGIELLYRDLRDQLLPCSSRTLMRHVHRVPAVLDTNFPGYAESGLMGWITREE